MKEQHFVRRRADFEPAYLELFQEGELQKRAAQAVAELADCRLCPRHCAVNRLTGESGVCKNGRYARVASYHPHLGEEDCLRGWYGSGTIFFAGCNLRCVFCQNFDISQGRAYGQEVSAAQLAAMMLRLQEQGCHNINLVTPEHVVPQIIEALQVAVDRGLRLPLVYNTSAYDSRRSLELLDGIVDIYMPDFKLWNKDNARRYLKAADYPTVAREALMEMHRQVGALVVDEQGLAMRGVLVRHLVMPNMQSDSAAILRFLAEELSTDTYVNLMAQYYPAGKVNDERYGEINRRITHSEYGAALASASEAGLWRFDSRERRRPGW